MSELKIYVNTQFGNIRAIEENGKALFIAADVAKALGYRNTKKAILDHVKENHKIDGVTIRDPIGRNQKAVAIDEAGLYSLVLRSKLPKAEAFQEWVVSEVLPSIRNTGGYSTKPIEQTLATIDTKTLAKMVAAELKTQQEKQVKALLPKGNAIYVSTTDYEALQYIRETVYWMERLERREFYSVVRDFVRALVLPVEKAVSRLGF